MNLKDTAICENLAELHAKFVGTINEVPYCQLTTRRGLCNQRELDYISEHGCPVCHKGLHENTTPGSTAAMFARSYNAMRAHVHASQPAAQPKPEVPLGPGVGGPAPHIAPVA
jgi:hypothetical protein